MNAHIATFDGLPLATPLASDALPALKAEPAPVWIRQGTAEYRRTGLAFFLAGFATFSLIYCVQPLLPLFASSFRVRPAESSLALSLTTSLVAVSIVMAGAFSQALGRRWLMFWCMALAAILDLATAFDPSWHGLLAARAMEGLLLGGVPAVAMAYLAEEIEPAHLGKTMGLYIGGNAFGGMAGRVGMALIAEAVSWQAALGVLGVLCLLASVGFLLLLPRARNFVPRPGFDLGFHWRAWNGHLRNGRLLLLFAAAFVLTSVFVTIFNYATFRLSEAPYNLSQTTISMIFLVYAFGMVSSSIAGGFGGRFGRRPLLAASFLLMLAGVGLTLAYSLIAVMAGIALVTIGFFAGHTVASGSVGPLAGVSKGHAASLYLLFFYMGSSITGSAGGWFWQHGGWPMVAGLTGGLALAGALLAVIPAGHAQPAPVRC
jgi:MFS transporter, YNFM family, putative membrane transport protein